MMMMMMSFVSAEVMKASQQAIERGVKDCLFIDYKRRSGHFDVTTVASIKEVTEKQVMLIVITLFMGGDWAIFALSSFVHIVCQSCFPIIFFPPVFLHYFWTS